VHLHGFEVKAVDDGGGVAAESFNLESLRLDEVLPLHPSPFLRVESAKHLRIQKRDQVPRLPPIPQQRFRRQIRFVDVRLGESLYGTGVSYYGVHDEDSGVGGVGDGATEVGEDFGGAGVVPVVHDVTDKVDGATG